MKPEFEKILNQPLTSFTAKEVIRSKRPTLKEAWHFHPEIELCFTLKSDGKRFVGNDIAEYQAGDFVMFGSNLPHGFITEMESEQIVIQMLESFLGLEFLEKPEMQVIKELFQKADRGIKFHGQTIKKAKKISYKILQLEGLAKLLKLLDLLLLLATSEEYTLITNDSFHPNVKIIELERIQIVYDYILQNYQENITLEEASKLISMTKSSFCKFLKKHAKKTFSEMVNNIRIEHACNLIITSNKNISSIAFESGFNDISYFSRSFTKQMHMSPKAYINQHRNTKIKN
jgi:AraC-like DNA-binding protein